MDATAFRFDPATLPPEASRLRDQVRAFLRDHQHLMTGETDGNSRPFSKAMAARGWLGMTWPRQYGGQERGAMERYVIVEEMLAARAPLGFHYIAERQSGPNILKFGTDAQRKRFLPAIANADLSFCIGMSEPDSGSDLAGTAVKVPGGYRINGTKLWTSNAHTADWMILFCKMAKAGEETDRHAGATQFLVDLKNSPRIAVTPVINLLGEHHFNQVFLTDLFVPDDCLLGEEGSGWQQVTSELGFERSAPDRFLVLFALLKEMVRLAGPDPSPAEAAGIGRMVAQLATLRRMSLSIAGMMQEGRQPLTEAAVVKDLGTRYEQDLPNVARTLFPGIEPEQHSADSYAAMLAAAVMNAPRLSIQGGTREILRGIIARGHGLR
jgi:alkylation response protein AidB-like acyl-CoA dehydrogenase